jgi:hypothetical protein
MKGSASMEFHRTRTLRLWIGFGSIVLGLFGAFEIFVQWQRFVVRSGWFYQHMTRDFSFHGVAYFLPLLIPVGIYVLVRGLGPFHRRIDEYGVTVENDSANMRIALPWQGIAAMSIERKPGDSKEADPYLVLWPIPGTNLVVKESYVLDGRPAYALVQLDELKESVDQLSAALRQYAGPRFLQPRGQAVPPPQYPGPQQPQQYPGQQYPGPPQQPPQYPVPQFPPPRQR